MTTQRDSATLDLTSDDPSYYAAVESPHLAKFAPTQAVAIDGRGEPGGTAHVQAIRALYTVAGIVQAVSAQNGAGFALPPLEGLWWVEDERPALTVPREEWCWQLLLGMPDSVAAHLVEQVADAQDLPVRPVQLAEGLCVQALHVGPYEREPETLAAMAEVMERHGLTTNGRHHEIYLTSVTDGVPPERIRTILRQPVRQAV